MVNRSRFRYGERGLSHAKNMVRIRTNEQRGAWVPFRVRWLPFTERFGQAARLSPSTGQNLAV